MVSTRKVLLLNASYEALSLVSPPKALTLVWRRVAEIIELDPGHVVRSPRFVFDVPSVVRLTQYVNIQARQNRATQRNRILARDRYRCQYCGKKGSAFDLTMDHVLPRSRGGRTVADNLVTACRTCNNRKGDRTPEEARMPLLMNPAALYYGLERAALQHAAEARPEWRKYLYLHDHEQEMVA
jgi:5-methylcytosine-specific restriction endonuclease McrA